MKYSGVTKDVFSSFMVYIYAPNHAVECKDWLGLLELAHRLCLEELFDHAEINIIQELQASMDSDHDIIEETLSLLAPADVGSQLFYSKFNFFSFRL